MTENNFTLTQECLKEILSYSPETGAFTWLKRDRVYFKTNASFSSFNKISVGNIAGAVKSNKNGKSYLRISVFNQLLYAHRLAFLYMAGRYPINEVDHIDGNGLNNAWSNLRDVNRGENCRNTRLPSNNTSGSIGVYWDKEKGKWQAQIQFNNKISHLGYFDDIDNAIAAREQAEIKYNFNKNHGSIRPL